MIVTMKAAEDITPPSTAIALHAFPEEVILALFSFLTPKELGTVASTCHLLKDISEDDELWYQLYRDTKKKYLLETLPFTATAYFPGSKAEEMRKEQLRWKARFKETFHIRAGTIFDKVELNLDKTICEEGGDLSGQMVVTVASEKLRCHGIFVRISGTERSFAVIGRSVSKTIQELGEWNYPVYGSTSWESRQATSFSLRRGIYHVPFSFPVSVKGKRGEALSASRSSKGRGYNVQVEYAATALLVTDKMLSGTVQSAPVRIQMIPRSLKGKQPQQTQHKTQEETIPQAAQATPVRSTTVQKDFLFGGSATFGMTLDKQSFTRGEQVNVVIDVDNKSSYSIKSAELSLNEWSLSRSGRGESRVKGSQSYPLDLYKGTQQLILPFNIEWEDKSDAFALLSSAGEAPVKQGHYLQLKLGIPYAVDPELLIPITLLQPYPH